MSDSAKKGESKEIKPTDSLPSLRPHTAEVKVVSVCPAMPAHDLPDVKAKVEALLPIWKAIDDMSYWEHRASGYSAMANWILTDRNGFLITHALFSLDVLATPSTRSLSRLETALRNAGRVRVIAQLKSDKLAAAGGVTANDPWITRLQKPTPTGRRLYQFLSVPPLKTQRVL